MDPAPPDELPAADSPLVPARKPFAKRAAGWSLWLSFAGLAILIGPLALAAALEPKSDELFESAGIHLFTFLGISVLPLLIWLAGAALGAVALRGMRTVGRRGILGRAFAGVTLNCLFLCGVAMKLVSMDMDWKVLENEHEKVRTDQRDWSALQEAERAFSLKAHVVLTNYQTAGATLADPPVLDMALVRNKQDLQVREDLARRFVKASQDSLEFTTNSLQLYRQELLRHDMTQKMRERALKKFVLSLQGAEPTMVPLRETDLRRGQAILKILTMLDEDWGNWKYNPATGRVDIQSAELRPKYSVAKKEVDEATAEEIKLQQQAEVYQRTNR